MSGVNIAIPTAGENGGNKDSDFRQWFSWVVDPPNQPTRICSNPMLVGRWTPSLPPNEVTWMVKALEQKRRKAGEIKVKLNGVMKF